MRKKEKDAPLVADLEIDKLFVRKSFDTHKKIKNGVSHVGTFELKFLNFFSRFIWVIQSWPKDQ